MNSLNARTEYYNPKHPESVGFANDIANKTNQSCAILALVQSEFTGENKNKSNDEIIFNALQSVYLELIDIKEIANHYHENYKNDRHKKSREGAT